MASQQAEDCLHSGASRKKGNALLVAQGADLAAFNRKLGCDHTAPVVVELKANRSGILSRCDARLMGEIIRNLGGGRLTKESVINSDVGLDQIAKLGEAVKLGAVLTRILAASPRKRTRQGFNHSRFATHPPRLAVLVAEVVVPK